MKQTFKSILVLLLLFNASAFYGQVITLNYTLNSTVVHMQEKQTAMNTVLKKEGNTLEWTQTSQGNSNATVFEIESTTGEWNQNTSKGKLVYILKIPGFNGSFTLKEKNGKLLGLLNITSKKKKKSVDNIFKFKVTTITYL